MPAAIKNDKLIDTLSGHFVKSYSTGYALSNAVSMYLALPGLRAFWPFSSYDENTDLYDLSGQGRVLTNNNTVSMANTYGIIPYADFVSANTEYFSRTDESGLSITASIALVAWCWFDAESTGNEVGIISKWNNNVGVNRRSYALYKTATNVFRFVISDDGTTVYTLDSTVSYAASQWFFIAAGLSPSTYMRICVNGVWDEDVTGIPASIYDSIDPLFLGRHDNAAPKYLDGRMTLAAIHKPSTNYNTVISSLFHHTRPLLGVRS